jgi:protein O-mannosyl-transferase
MHPSSDVRPPGGLPTIGIGAYAFIAALVAILVAAPSLSNGFAWDDVQDVSENESVQSLGRGLSLLATPYRIAVPPPRSPYRPVTTVSFALNWWMAAGSPVPFHVTNVLLHGAVTGLVVLLLAGLGAAGSLAFLGGVVFAVHPVHVEAVANIVGRSELLMAFFTLSALLVFLQSEWKAAVRITLVCGLYALALASKESGVATPAFIGMLVLWPRPFEPGSRGGNRDDCDRPRYERLFREWPLFVGMGVVLGAYLFLRYSVLGTLLHSDSATYISGLSTPLRLTTAIANFGEFARLLLVPMDLSVHYGPAVLLPAGATSVRFLIGGLLGLVMIGAAVVARSRVPWVTLSVVWVAGGLLVVSNLFFPIGVWVAERTLYLPSIAVSISVVGLLTPLWRGGDAKRRNLAVGVLGTVLVLGTVRSLMRAPVWKDSETVAANLAEEHPESYRAQWWLARSFADGGDFPRALRWYDSAIDVNPQDVLLRLGRIRALLLAGEAEAAAQALAELQPAYPDYFIYLAQSAIMRDRVPEARAAVREGLERFPEEVRLLRQARQLGIAR